MADATSNLNIVVSAKDNASGVISNISEETKGLTGSVFSAVAAFALLEEGLKAAAGFVEQSVGAYIDAQKQLDLVQATVTSMGLSFEKVSPQITAFGEKMAALGVDNEQAELSMVQLAKVAGGDLSKGMQLAKLASDLTASGFGTLESNTDNLTKVLSGKGERALMEYRINLDASATTAQQLDAIQAKVTQTTEQYADTIPGKIGVVKESYKQLQQGIGQDLVLALESAFQGSGNLTDAMESMRTAGQFAGIVLVELVDEVVVLAKGFNTIGVGIASTITIWKNWGDAMKGNKDALLAINDAVGKSDDAFGGFKNAIANMLDPTAQLASAQGELNSKNKDIASSAALVGDGVVNANRSASDSFKAHQDAVDNLKKSYDDLRQGAAQDLATLTDTFNSDMKSINDSIAKTQENIGNLTGSFQQQQTTDTSSIADQIVASENKIADLKKQIAAATTVDQKKTLNDQLTAEQANYDSSADFRAANKDAIAAAEKKASLTDLQRAVADYNDRRALAQKEYTEKLADLTNELNDENNKKNAEVALYNQRSTEINAILTKANQDFQDFSTSRLATITDEVTKEIDLFKQLQAAISAVKSASASAISTVIIPGTSSVAGHRALGGPVSAGSTYIVGEKGPELFSPNSSGNITPNNALRGGSSNVSIIIKGGTYLSEDAAKKIGDKIINQWRRKVGKI